MVSGLLELAGVKSPQEKIWCNALPPGAMSVKELKTLVNSHEMYIFLDDFQSLIKIEKTESGYTVTTDYQQVEVELRYKSQGIGPQRPMFEWKEPQIASNEQDVIGFNTKFRQIINSNELYELLGSADMLKSITYTGDGFKIETLQGKKHEVSV